MKLLALSKIVSVVICPGPDTNNIHKQKRSENTEKEWGAGGRYAGAAPAALSPWKEGLVVGGEEEPLLEGVGSIHLWIQHIAMDPAYCYMECWIHIAAGG